MSNVNANINITVDSQQAIAQLRSLQAQVNAVNKGMAATGGAAAAQQIALTRALVDGAKASGRFTASVVPIASSIDTFSNSLERNKLSLGEYTRFAASQLPGMSRIFRREMDTMTQVAEDRVKRLNTQFVALGDSASGASKAIALVPTSLDSYSSRTAIAAQKQMLFNKMIDDGSTKLLNWGKNTQWAGRQLMVGFSIPLGMMGAAAAQAFIEIDKSSIAFRRVYGDLQTTTAEMENNLAAVKDLGREYNKYGIALADTIDTASRVAATGATNESLMVATKETLRLATLGQMEYNEALSATTALQTAFLVSNEDLASTIDFLNAVENQTVLTLQDISAAIPRVAPVIKGLGGDVKDLAVMMTAMREGGITAEQGANALKSGLASLINPTKRATETLAGFGINIDAIVQANKGDLMGTVTAFSTALDTLSEFQQQQALEQVFGKYQFARLGALFKNINREGGQAARTLELAGSSIEDLASLSENELSKIEEATSTKFKAAIEELKTVAAPVGEAFLKALTPIIEFASKVLDKFNELPDGVKTAIALIIGGIAGIGPIILMTVGLIGNGLANIAKGVQTLRRAFSRIKGDASAFQYLANEELGAMAASASLEGKVTSLTSSLQLQAKSVSVLTGLYGKLAGSAQAAALAMPTIMGGIPTGRGGGKPAGPMKMANGGVVPGTGSGDKTPALLEPGEMVVTKKASDKYGPIIAAMNSGTLPGFQEGLDGGSQSSVRPLQVQSMQAQIAGHLGGAMLVPVREELARVEANIRSYSTAYVEHLRSLDRSGQQYVRLYSNFVALMSQEVNEKMKQGQATIAEVKSEIGNPASQVELKRQLKLLGVQDDEISRVLQTYVTNLNTELDKAQARLGTGAIASADMDRLLTRAAVSAGGRTLSDPRQRAAFLSMVTSPTTYVPEGTGGRGRRGILSRTGGREAPEKRSYTALRSSEYGVRAATKFSGEAIAASGFSRQQLQSTFASMPEAAKRAIIATRGDLEKALPIFRQYAENAGETYTGGLVTAISTSRNTVERAVASNRRAASPGPWAAPMGEQDGGAYAKGFTGAVSRGTTKEQYKKSQSADRRERYDIGRMQSIGMTDTQTLRQLRRLEESKARAEKQQLKEAQRMTSAAQQSAVVMGATAQELSRGQKLMAKTRGAAGKITEYLNAPVGRDGTQTRGGRMRSVGQGSMAGITGLTMAASFAGGAVGEMAQKIMPAVFGLQGLAMMIPMLTNPMGIAILAITALVGSLVWLRKSVDETAKSAAAVGANMGAAANRMEILQEATGFEAPITRAEDRMFRFNKKDLQAMSEFQSYFESEGGSKFITELKGLSNEERYVRISSIIAQGIANGMDPEKAKAFGQAVASQINDAMLNAKLLSDFSRGIFKSGSQAAIDLVKERQIAATTAIASAPGMASSPISQALGTSGATNIWGESAALVGAGAGAGAAIGGAIGSAGFALGPLGAVTAPVGAAIGAVIGTIATGIPVFFKAKGAIDELNKNVETVAKTFGSSIQIMKEVLNAEQLLLEERRNGAISTEEYAKRSAELQAIEEGQASRLKEAIIKSTDEGATQQSISDQLMISTGMEEGLAGAVARGVGKEDVSQKIFSESYKDLSEQQQQVVGAAIAETLKGITPENAAEKLARIESDYAAIADQLVTAATDGLTQQEFTKLAESEQVKNWAKGAFKEVSTGAAEGLGFRGTSRGTAQENLSATVSTNLMNSKSIFEGLGLSINEVTVQLQALSDVDFAAEIGADPEKLNQFAELLVGLEGFNGISIEKTFQYMSEQGLTTEQAISGVKSSVDNISKIKLSKKLFGNTKLDAQALTMELMNAGVALADIPKTVSDSVEKATTLIKGLGADAKNELGNYKITTELVYNMFGQDVPNAKGITALLQSAYPKQLPASTIPIMLALMNPEMLQALAGISPQMANFMKENPTATSFATNAPGMLGQAITPEMREAVATFDLVKELSAGDVPAAANVPEDKNGGGGEEDPLKQLEDEINNRLALFGNIEKMAKQIKNKKTSVAKALQDLTFTGSLVDKLRKAGISEMMIAEILEKGVGFAQKMLNSLKKTKQLDQKLIASMRVEQVSVVSQKTAIDLKRANAAKKLKSQGFTPEEITQTLSDDQVVEVLAATKKGSKGWEEYINKLNEAEAAFKKAQLEMDPVTYQLGEMSNAFDDLMAPLEAMNAEFDLEFGNIERRYQPRIDASQKIIDGLEEQIALINEEIAAIEKLNQADQNTIRGLNRKKELIQRQIEDLERQNELDQRRIDTLRREDEMRNRVGEALSHDLDMMSQQEEKIREAYDERIKALDKVAAINDYIVDQQQKQLGLSQAIAEGDIYAAAGAIQEMRAGSAQFAQQQMRTGMQEGMEQNIENLRTAGGLTREQAEEQIRLIKEQSYQTSLKIRDIEDGIYTRNLSMIPLKERQRDIDREIRDIQDVIYGRESDIIGIQTTRISPLEASLAAENKKLASLEKQVDTEKENVKVNGLSYKELTNQIEAQNDLYNYSVAQVKANGQNAKSVVQIGKKWASVAAQINEANKAALDATKIAGNVFDATLETIAVERDAKLITPEEAKKREASATKARDKALEDIEKTRKEKAEALLKEARGVYAGGKIKKYAVGNVVGDGGRDSVPAMLTPGEYVVRKAMVDKYGTPFFDAINTGSLSGPRYRTTNNRSSTPVLSAPSTTANISAPVYNTYDMQFNINGSNASADDIANKVMVKMKQISSRDIRSNRA